MNLRKFILTLAAAVSNGVAVSQTTGGATNLVLNGSLVSSGVATFDVARRVVINATGNLSAITFTVTGTDRSGNVLVSTLAGPNNGSVFTAQDFLTVTSVAVSAAVSAVTVGTNGVASTPWFVGDWHNGKLILIDTYVDPGSVLTYTVESTPTNLNDGALNVDARLLQAQNPIVYPSTDMSVVGASTSQQTNFMNALPGMRATINSYTSGTLTILFVPSATHTF